MTVNNGESELLRRSTHQGTSVLRDARPYGFEDVAGVGIFGN
jgi:hypothetical protein